MRLLLAITLCAASCQRADELASAAPAVALPATGIQVAAGAPLQAIIDAAAPGATLLLAPGTHRGPIVIQKPLVLAGPREAIVDSEGDGTAITVNTDDCQLLGFTVHGSGRRFDLQDGAVRVRGRRNVIEGLLIRAALFGIQVELSQHARIALNHVIGTGDPAMGLRGDGIRLWETTDSVVVDNLVEHSRDVVVWYSSRNKLQGNEVRHCRYGTHFMYSHGNEVTLNRYVDDVVGVFVMYSHDLVLRQNLLARAGGAAGIGLGLKESGNITVADNWLLACATGIYLDTSPLDITHHNRFEGNVVALCETAVSFHASVTRNGFHGNVFRDNGAVVAVGGGGDALGCGFVGNHYDTYQGYDLDGDGVGDLPFEFRRLSTQLESRHPELALLHGAPAMQMIDLVGEVMPLFQPRTLLRDPAPRMHAPAPGWTPEADDAR